MSAGSLPLSLTIANRLFVETKGSVKTLAIFAGDREPDCTAVDAVRTVGTGTGFASFFGIVGEMTLGSTPAAEIGGICDCDDIGDVGVCGREYMASYCSNGIKPLA